MTILLALLTSFASAETVAVSTWCQDRAMPCEAAQSVLWHAMWDRHGHDTLLLDRDENSPTDLTGQHALTTLYEVDVGWEAKRQVVDGRHLFGWSPIIDVREFSVVEGEAQLVRSWVTWGTMALFQPRTDDTGEAIVNLPQVALQETMDLAIGPITPPAHDFDHPLVEVPIIVAADEEYREFYGDRWRFVAELRIERASALLRRAGIALKPVGAAEWNSPDDSQDLDVLLDAFAPVADPTNGAIYVGFTQQSKLATTWHGDLEDVGRAYLPGNAIVVADQATVPGHRRGWDQAAEATTIAHEVLHALGVPHNDDDDWLMSDRKRWTTFRMAEGTRGLAHAAAVARFESGNPSIAYTNLTQAAAAHLADPEYQLQYVSENLAAGPWWGQD